MGGCIKFVGLDVHKSTIAVAIAAADRLPPVSYGQIENTPEAITRLVKRLCKGNRVRFCYEAGPRGYEVHRQITKLGHRYDVVAPSLIPRKAGDRVKTDRRDALNLARLYRAGELTAVWVPDQEQEAMRDLVRAREDMKGIKLRTRQRLGAFLLRHGLIYKGKSTWTKAHFRWLEEVRLAHRSFLSRPETGKPIAGPPDVGRSPFRGKIVAMPKAEVNVRRGSCPEEPPGIRESRELRCDTAELYAAAR